MLLYHEDKELVELYIGWVKNTRAIYQEGDGRLY